jgi:hypothetical protein
MKEFYDSFQARFDLLDECTVRVELTGGNGHGSGFFVAPNLLITCFHVIEKATTNPSNLINIIWKEQSYTAEIEKSLQVNQSVDLKKVDLALLRIKNPVPNHPCVYLDIYNSNRVREKLYSYGYTDINKYGESSTFILEGFIDLGDSLHLLKFKEGQVRPGASGSPLMNERTTKVCGVVKSTRDRSNDIGGGAIPAETIFTCWPELIKHQQEFHQRDNRWQILLPSTVDYSSLQGEYRFVLQQLESLGAGFGSNVPENAKKGFEYLTSALHSDLENSRFEQINKANEAFTSLVTYDNSKEMLKGVAGRKIEKKFIASLGYWGNFKCFDLSNEKRAAYIQIYKCSMEYIDIGYLIFPSKFFNKNYSIISEDLNNQLEEIQSVFNRIKRHTFANYRLKNTGIIAGILALSGSAIVSAFIFRNGDATNALVQGSKFLSQVKIPKPKNLIIEKLSRKIYFLNEEIEKLKTELISECETKIKNLSDGIQEFEKISFSNSGSKITRVFEPKHRIITPVSSTLEIEYENLEDLLSQGLWKEANLETYQMMVRLVGQEIGDALDEHSIRIFPCSDLQAIDKIWVDYSNGHFGFSIQKKIYRELRNYDAFCEQLGWAKEGLLGRIINYKKVIWSLDAPKGHLPYHLWANIQGIDENGSLLLGEMLPFWEDYIFSRFEKSELLAQVTLASISTSSEILKLL